MVYAKNERFTGVSSRCRKNLEIPRCHLADCVKEFYWNACRTCSTIIFPHSTNQIIVLRRCGCRCPCLSSLILRERREIAPWSKNKLLPVETSNSTTLRWLFSAASCKGVVPHLGADSKLSTRDGSENTNWVVRIFKDTSRLLLKTRHTIFGVDFQYRLPVLQQYSYTFQVTMVTSLVQGRPPYIIDAVCIFSRRQKLFYFRGVIFNTSYVQLCLAHRRKAKKCFSQQQK